ncbi:MAG: hypothetical protein ACI9SC_001139, partial [Gammaproteobacteria bacterium]
STYTSTASVLRIVENFPQCQALERVLGKILI